MIKKLTNKKQNIKIIQHDLHNHCDNTQYKLILTNQAQKKIKKLMLNDPNILGLRIDIKKSGCAGFGYMFKKVLQQKFDNTDIVFEYRNGAKLFVPSKVISFINGSELDYIQDGLNYAFKFNNPNIRHACGCGESFNI